MSQLIIIERRGGGEWGACIYIIFFGAAVQVSGSPLKPHNTSVTPKTQYQPLIGRGTRCVSLIAVACVLCAVPALPRLVIYH